MSRKNKARKLSCKNNLQKPANPQKFIQPHIKWFTRYPNQREGVQIREIILENKKEVLTKKREKKRYLRFLKDVFGMEIFNFGFLCKLSKKKKKQKDNAGKNAKGRENETIL